MDAAYPLEDRNGCLITNLLSDPTQLEVVVLDGDLATGLP